MRFTSLLREAASTAWANKVPTALVAMLVAIMCATTLATVGRTAAAEQQVADRLDAAGSRVLVVTDTRGGELISPAVVQQTHGLSVTERAVGVQIPVDVVNLVVGQGGTRVPAWTIDGDLSEVLTLTAGRWPGPGEALVSAQAQAALGMDHPVGGVQLASSTQVGDYSVVGAFEPREPFGQYAAGLVIAAEPGVVSDSLYVVVTDSSVASAAQSAVLGLVAPPDFDSVSVDSPVALAELQAEVAADLGTFGRTLLFGVLGAGALLVAIVVLSDVLVRRKDLGRRRALGATRGTIVAMVIARTLLPALLGAGIGTAAGLWVADRFAALPPWEFTTGTAILALLAAIASAILPALYAATRDPVRVLRTP
ncbi:permease [Ornithinimicrobium faecis]|uniref:Permease n=1 Tax=Ornithinimicrobium faecis TaxID=2934158 RepID=A0ABY4YYN1_9MICO|nr:FtsX-like permease family protein [Ornithinimicrobium sp. HY1793]USQ81881.1 permease [Ornithinimicrobium sp. HY1793]